MQNLPSGIKNQVEKVFVKLAKSAFKRVKDFQYEEDEDTTGIHIMGGKSTDEMERLPQIRIHVGDMSDFKGSIDHLNKWDALKKQRLIVDRFSLQFACYAELSIEASDMAEYLRKYVIASTRDLGRFGIFGADGLALIDSQYGFQTGVSGDVACAMMQTAFLSISRQTAHEPDSLFIRGFHLPGDNGGPPIGWPPGAPWPPGSGGGPPIGWPPGVPWPPRGGGPPIGWPPGVPWPPGSGGGGGGGTVIIDPTIPPPTSLPPTTIEVPWNEPVPLVKIGNTSLVNCTYDAQGNLRLHFADPVGPHTPTGFKIVFGATPSSEEEVADLADVVRDLYDFRTILIDVDNRLVVRFYYDAPNGNLQMRSVPSDTHIDDADVTTEDLPSFGPYWVRRDSTGAIHTTPAVSRADDTEPYS